MKNSILKSVLAIVLFTAISSCTNSSRNDGGSFPLPIIAAENTWSLNAYNFSRNNSTQSSVTYTNGNPFTQVNIDSNISGVNDSFKTCNVIFSFNTSTEGTYIAKSINTVASFTTLKYIRIQCLVSNTAGVGAIYESIDSNTAVIVTKINNKFIINTTEPISMVKTSSDNNLPNAPATMIFKCNNIQ